jgi:methylmalonyl-CoA mutase N-terminal domain/subunit
MYYEHKKHDGSLPLIGVNTFLGGKESHAEGGEVELMRSTDEEKGQQVDNVEAFRAVVALANKLARISWVIVTTGEPFDMKQAFKPAA